MGTIQYNNKKKKIHLVARSDITSSRSIAVFSPINGDKQIIDFGLNLKELNALFYSDEPIDKNIDLTMFTNEFQGKIYVQNIKTNKYSGTPYMYINITGIGEDSNSSDNVIPTGIIHTIRGLENVYMVNYQTNYLPQIGTGFSLAVTKKEKHIEGVIDFQYDNKPYKIGSKKSVLSGYGQTSNRMNDSLVSNFMDPLSLALQKSVIISSTELANSQFSKLNLSNTEIIFISEHALLEILNDLSKGEVEKIFELLFKDDSVQIDLSLIKTSPIVQALKSNASGGDVVTAHMKNVFQKNITANLIKVGLNTVGSILAQLLPMFGLEIYHVEDNRYIVQPPRFLFFDDTTKSSIKIDETEISNISLQQPTSSLMTLMIPEVNFENMAFQHTASDCAIYFATKIIEKLQKITKLPMIRIQTYSVPNMMIPHYIISQKVPLIQRANQYLRKVWVYYSSLAFQSIFSKLHTGSIEINFRPDILEAYKWYQIKGEWYFVTGIRHSITRGAVTTVLDYSHKYDPEVQNFFQSLLSDINNDDGFCAKFYKEKFKNQQVQTPLNSETKPKEPEPEKIDLKKKKLKSMET